MNEAEGGGGHFGRYDLEGGFFAYGHFALNGNNILDYAFENGVLSEAEADDALGVGGVADGVGRVAGGGEHPLVMSVIGREVVPYQRVGGAGRHGHGLFRLCHGEVAVSAQNVVGLVGVEGNGLFAGKQFNGCCAGLEVFLGHGILDGGQLGGGVASYAVLGVSVLGVAHQCSAVFLCLYFLIGEHSFEHEAAVGIVERTGVVPEFQVGVLSAAVA